MQAGLWCSVLSLVLLSSSLIGQSAGKVFSTEPFSFRLYTSDIFPWVTGKKQGAVKAEKNAMGQALEQFLLTARTKVALAFYGVSRQPWFLHTIAHLRQQGVQVRAVVDQKRGAVGDWLPENFTYRGTAKLPLYVGEANIVIDLNNSGHYPRPTIMHHKYAIVDNERVWFGTANLSHTGVGAEYNANVALTIASPPVAALFGNEFRQMFEEHRFSKAKVPQAGARTVVFPDGTEVSMWFSPQDNVIDNAIIPSLAAAQETIDVGMFYLTERTTVQALCAAVARQVKVRIIVDAVANAHPSSPYWDLRRCGIDVRVENWGGKMHMKTALIDGKLASNRVIVGSMNWSKSGNTRNDENLAVIKHNQQLAQELGTYFNRLWRTLSNKSQRRKIFAEGLNSINSCFDGLDNDHDGRVDAQDRGCWREGGLVVAR